MRMKGYSVWCGRFLSLPLSGTLGQQEGDEWTTGLGYRLGSLFVLLYFTVLFARLCCSRDDLLHQALVLH